MQPGFPGFKTSKKGGTKGKGRGRIYPHTCSQKTPMYSCISQLRTYVNLCVRNFAVLRLIACFASPPCILQRSIYIYRVDVPVRGYSIWSEGYSALVNTSPPAESRSNRECFKRTHWASRQREVENTCRVLAQGDPV
jgi:hypothetical protein